MITTDWRLLESFTIQGMRLHLTTAFYQDLLIHIKSNSSTSLNSLPKPPGKPHFNYGIATQKAPICLPQSVPQTGRRLSPQPRRHNSFPSHMSPLLPNLIIRETDEERWMYSIQSRIKRRPLLPTAHSPVTKSAQHHQAHIFIFMVVMGFITLAYGLISYAKRQASANFPHFWVFRVNEESVGGDIKNDETLFVV
jgi:hypothetical protein